MRQDDADREDGEGGKPGYGPAPVPPSDEPMPVRLTVPLLLAAGWGALLTFSVVFLFEDSREAVAVAALERSPPTAPSAIMRNAEPGPRLPVPDPIVAAEAAPESATRIVRVSTDVPPVPQSRVEAPSLERAGFVGTWGPTSLACGAHSRRRGYLPATITEDGARAGKTQCRFRNGRRDGIAWTAAADCTERGKHWTSQIRLVVDGDRLTWTSAKGSSSYIRCGRRDG